MESFRFDRLASLADDWQQELTFVVDGPTLLSGFAFFVHVEFAATPPLKFEGSTSWQYIICLMAPRPFVLEDLWQVVRMKANGYLAQLPAHYSVAAAIG